MTKKMDKLSLEELNTVNGGMGEGAVIKKEVHLSSRPIAGNLKYVAGQQQTDASNLLHNAADVPEIANTFLKTNSEKNAPAGTIVVSGGNQDMVV